MKLDNVLTRMLGIQYPIIQGALLINITAARRLRDTPLIAAGGIGDAHGFVAALAMGALGVYQGKAMMATKEFMDRLIKKSGEIMSQLKDRGMMER